MLEQLEVNTLTGGQPWKDFADPRNVRPRADDSLTAIKQREMEVIWTSAQAVYSSQIAIGTVVINTLINAVPEGYKHA